MKKLYFTITGTKYRHGQDFFKKGMKVRLIKEPDNEFDKEAIKVEMDGLGLVGYVATAPIRCWVRATAQDAFTTKSGRRRRGKWYVYFPRVCSAALRKTVFWIDSRVSIEFTGRIECAMAYELTDTETEVTLTAKSNLLGPELGSQTFPIQ